MAESSQTRLAYIAETTYGVTPTDPAFKAFRFTGEGLAPNIGYISSNEITPLRQVTDLTQVSGEAAGPVNIEMSYGSYDDFFEALFGGTWSTNVLKVGNLDKSFTIEKTFETGATDQYHRFLGARVNTLELRLSAREQITGAFGFMAKEMTTGTAIIEDATYGDPNTNPVMNAATGFQSITMSGITQPELMSLNLSITNNMAQQAVMGSKGAKGVRKGRFVVTGSGEAYFGSSEMLSAYLNDVATDLAFSIGGASTMKYNLQLGNVKFSNVQVLTPGNDQDVMASFEFQAIYDASDASTMVLTRVPS